MFKTVLFTKAHGVYQAGQIAGFLPADADKLIAAGFATAYVSPPEQPAKRGFVNKMITKKPKATPKG